MMGFPRLGGSQVISTDGIFLTRKCQSRHANGRSLSYPTGVETVRYGIFPTRITHSAAGIFSSQSPRLMFRWWNFLTRSTSTTLWAPLIWIYGQMNRRQFLCRGSFHPYFSAGDTTMLRRCYLYFDDGITPTRETTSLWDFPFKNSLLDLLPLGGTVSSL